MHRATMSGLGFTLALAAMIGAGCRADPGLRARRSRGAPSVQGAAAARTPAPATISTSTPGGLRPASGEVIVPPVLSGWAPGTDFVVPAPIRLGEAPPASPYNMLMNASFEQGTEPWWYFPDRPHWGGFVVSGARAAEGAWSARLELDVDAAHPPPAKTHIRGVIQSLAPTVFPRRVSGRYFVERWERGPADMYVQFVVIALGAVPPGGGTGTTNTQIRYLLAGIDHPPFGISNAKFVYVTREQPVLGQWVSFERDLSRDYSDFWGFVPETFDSVRILFEVRYDNLDMANPPEMHAVVYFDDLFLGN